ncbi:MAG: protein-disulfide reductase DsbD [Gammaproteobacteria bacterium]|nr:protein-disulfide reductase DsbD [Gammaproteobacteria bacterium]TVQ47201.1 MAG: protein-disulfide reductase DsbD [Gammaproteobacteria bacterium]
MKSLLLLLLPLLLAGWPSSEASAQQVRPPAEVFLFEASANDTHILLDWEVLPEHYLYRERFAFSSDTPGIELGEPIFPRGIMHEDEFFGRQEIYRGPFRIEIPYQGDVDELSLAIRLQGCADIGLCYPPLTWPATVSLPASASGAGNAGRAAAGPNLAALVGAGNGEFLPPEQAFEATAELTGPNELTVRWTPAPGYYLYRESLAASISDGPAQAGSPVIPAGTPHEDEFFGSTEVFFGAVDMIVPFSRSTAQPAAVTFSLAYQGCAEAGLCYPPLTRDITLMLAATDAAAGAGGVAAGAAAPAASAAASAPPPVSEQDRLARLITEASLPLVLATFLGLGLLLAFTPCVLPMVPILSGIIAGQGKDVTTARAFNLSLAYVLGMALTYTAAGAVAAMAGAQVQAFFQQPWIIVTFSALFVLLALSMFGFFNLQMPSAVQSRLAEVSGRQKTGTFAGTAVIGALSALIVSACVAPPLVATLAVIGQTGDVLRGSLSLFVMSLGMGVPLLLVGTSAGKLLPKAGPWMNAIKVFFGILLLGVAVWMLERILPGAVVLALWAALAFIIAVYLGALEPLGDTAGPARRLGKSAGAMAGAYGLILLAGAATGGNDPLRPLANVAVGGAGVQVAERLAFRPIKTVADLERELASAAASGRPVMLDFTADWCVSCKEMERNTFPHPDVQAALADAILLKADVTANDRDDQALLRHFGIFGPPTIAFFDRNGQELAGYRLVGYVAARPFAEHARTALAN